jgi:hypothetical protein
MRLAPLLLGVCVLAGPAALVSGAEHFTVSASFQAPAKPAAEGAVSVKFVPKDPDVHINEEPAPRLKLDPAQALLADRQAPPPSKVPTFDPQTVKYLDTTFPVSFPVAWAGQPPKASQTVKATVVYYYCSQREGWCRKGSDEVEFGVP